MMKAFIIAFLISSLIFGAARYLLTGQGDTLDVYFLDIGQGDAAYIRAPNGNDMLIDAGPSRSVLRRLAEAMPWYDRAIDVVLETHPDADHIGGIPDVLTRYKVGSFVEQSVESANAIDDEIHRLLDEQGIKNILARRGMRIDFGDGAYFNILFPDKDPTHMETNDASIVGQMVFGSTSVMFTGDSPKSVENHLMELDGQNLQSDILKAGHHGSRTSSGEAYLRVVDPDYAIISAGKDNRYGHPHKEVIELLQRLGIGILRTDEEGTIGFESDGRNFSRKR